MLYFFRAYVVTCLLYSALIGSVHFQCFRQFSIKYPKNVINDNNFDCAGPPGPPGWTEKGDKGASGSAVSLSSSFQNLAKDLFRYLVSTTLNILPVDTRLFLNIDVLKLRLRNYLFTQFVDVVEYLEGE